MNAMVKVEVMDWDRFSIEDWLKQYGAYIQISRMKSGHQPDSLGVNQISVSYTHLTLPTIYSV